MIISLYFCLLSAVQGLSEDKITFRNALPLDYSALCDVVSADSA